MNVFGDNQLCAIVLDKLVEQGLIDDRQAQIAQSSEDTYSDILRYVSHEEFSRTLSLVSGDEFITTLDKMDHQVFKKYSNIINAFGAVALVESEKLLTVGVESTLDIDFLNSLEKSIGERYSDISIRYVIMSQPLIRSQTYISNDTSLGDENAASLLNTLAQQNDETNIGKSWSETLAGRALLSLIKEASFNDSSDIHIRPRSEREYEIRYRINGDMTDWHIVNNNVGITLSAVIKTAAKLDIGSWNTNTQDGSIKLNKEFSEKMTIRVSILPNMYAERIVMRLIGSSSADVTLENLGFLESELTDIKKGTSYTSGMILVTGPTGSGKNTTLYGMLHSIKDHRKTFLSIEDPIEGIVNFIDQCEVNEEKKLGFANALRSMLRQDPDVIMMTEIRDNETAKIASEAAMTGHVLYSTLHTNSCTDTILRITKMGIDDLDVARIINLLIAQRLVKKLCPKCRKSIEGTAENIIKYIPVIDKETLEKRGFIGKTYYITNQDGCSECKGQGYKGRSVVPEIVFIDSGYSYLLLKRDLSAFEQRMKADCKDMLYAALKRSELGIIGLDVIPQVLSK